MYCRVSPQAAAVRQADLAFDAVSLHAPTTAAKPDEIVEYWAMAHAVFDKHVSSKYPVLMGADINGRLGSIVDEAVGDHMADEEDQSGSAFRKLVQKIGNVVLNTMPCAAGTQAYTWLSNSGSKHRIDFVSVPADAYDEAANTWVDTQIDIATVKRDHFPVCANFRLRMETEEALVRVKRPICDVNALRDNKDWTLVQ